MTTEIPQTFVVRILSAKGCFSLYCHVLVKVFFIFLQQESHFLIILKHEKRLIFIIGINDHAFDALAGS
jgi:hypothetical protein